MYVRARNGTQYFITYDPTPFSHIYLISHKSKGLDFFKRYSRLVENQSNKILNHYRPIKEVNICGLFKAFCDDNGIAR